MYTESPMEQNRLPGKKWLSISGRKFIFNNMIVLYKIFRTFKLIPTAPYNKYIFIYTK